MKKRFSLIATLMFCLAAAVWAQPVTITPPSATIQPGGSVTLTASGAMYYQWSPATGLSTTEGPVTVASPMVTTTYTCEGYAPGDESVVNGDFSQGNSGFTSAYEYNSNLWNEGTYYVDSDASLHHENFHGYGHGGSGNFMMVNGSISPGTNVWTEQITVVPNKWYAFSTWACTLAGVAGQMALLQFSINGTQIGEVFSAPSTTMVWEQFYELWYSGTATTATITILNQNTHGDGNDFGLDDISFRELVLVGSPTCTVYVDAMTATATADDTELCEGESTTLHALPTGGSGNYSYNWSPANGLNNANVQHPEATPPVGTTTYSCHITDNSWGGTQDVSVSIVVHPNEEEYEHETICSGATYDFYGQTVSDPGTYEHLAQTQYGCDKTIYLHLENWPTYNETVVTEYICDGESYNFYGTDYTTNADVDFTDHTIHGCDSIVHLHLTVYPPNDTAVIDPSICIGQTYDFHGTLYDQDGQIAYFDTIDAHGCLKVEKMILTVDEYQRPPIVEQFECYDYGTTPSWYWDKTGTTYHEDTYDEIVLDDPNGGCPILHRLDLRFHEDYFQVVDKTACNEYYWPVTGVTYHESQYGITHTFHNAFGDKLCDSTFVLNLTIANYETNEFEVPYDERCDSYLWDPNGLDYYTNDDYDPENHIYTESGIYQRTYQNQMGCDSIVTMKVDFDYTPHPSAIMPMDTMNTAPHWVVTATEFQINTYDYTVYDVNPECHWDTVVWACDEAPHWVLEPFGEMGEKCKIYVLNREDDTIWLRAKVFNHCAPEDGIEQRYWLVCSFYGVGENQTQANFNVTPNPNNGLMTFDFENLTGKIDVKVYDMMGNLVDDIQTFNDLGSNSLGYDMQNCADGIYFFVATGKEGSVARKVIVQRF